MKKIIPAILALFLSAATLVGCGLSMPSGSETSGGSENSSTTDNNSTDGNSTGGSSTGGSSTGGNSGSTGGSTGSTGGNTGSTGGSTGSTGGGSTGGSTGGGSGDSELPDDGGEDTPPVDEALETLKAAYALKSGSSLSGTHTLTGVVTDVEKTGQGDICLTFVVGEYTQYPMYCYWLQDAAMVKVGYTITVSGTIKNYGGLVEFDHPTLVNYSSNGSGGTTGGGTGDSTGNFQYNNFTASERAIFIDLLGEVIPFAPNNEYYVEEYTDESRGEIGINFYTCDNSKADFNAYLQLFSAYTSDGTDVDDDGNTWYFFSKNDFYVDLAYYYGKDCYYIDVYAYLLNDDSGDTGGSSGGNTGGTDESLLTNDGAGLPTDADGVYAVDLTKGKYAKNVTEQGYYLGGCPTVGKPQVLVVPVQFSDVTAASKGYDIPTIKNAFGGDMGTTDYRSVHDYYYTSSYGQLDIQFTVLDSWFTPKYNSSYYLNATMDYYGEQVECGDQMVIDEILASLNGTMDLSKFDSDDNGLIDAVVIVNTLEIDYDVTMQWAYRYWNIYTDDDGNYYEYDGVSANDYLWASYQFLFEDENGDFTDTSAVNTYTYIHEFGHVLGADDYYDTAYVGSPMDGNDIMDSALGDHNAYTKFNFGWVTDSRLIVAENSVTVTLEDFSKNGDSIIIANDWDDELGAYQEYFVLLYYRNVGLNADGYFAEEGIVVYHVNASLYVETQDGETYYDVYNNNTDVSDEDGYGTENNLIELVSQASNDYVFSAGERLSGSTATDGGEKIAYVFTVDSLTSDSATLTFTKNN